MTAVTTVAGAFWFVLFALLPGISERRMSELVAKFGGRRSTDPAERRIRPFGAPWERGAESGERQDDNGNTVGLDNSTEIK